MTIPLLERQLIVIDRDVILPGDDYVGAYEQIIETRLREIAAENKSDQTDGKVEAWLARYTPKLQSDKQWTGLHPYYFQEFWAFLHVGEGSDYQATIEAIEQFVADHVSSEGFGDFAHAVELWSDVPDRLKNMIPTEAVKFLHVMYQHCVDYHYGADNNGGCEKKLLFIDPDKTVASATIIDQIEGFGGYGCFNHIGIFNRFDPAKDSLTNFTAALDGYIEEEIVGSFAAGNIVRVRKGAPNLAWAKAGAAEIVVKPTHLPPENIYVVTDLDELGQLLTPAGPERGFVAPSALLLGKTL